MRRASGASGKGPLQPPPGPAVGTPCAARPRPAVGTDRLSTVCEGLDDQCRGRSGQRPARLGADASRVGGTRVVKPHHSRWQHFGQPRAVGIYRPEGARAYLRAARVRALAGRSHDPGHRLRQSRRSLDRHGADPMGRDPSPLDRRFNTGPMRRCRFDADYEIARSRLPWPLPAPATTMWPSPASTTTLIDGIFRAINRARRSRQADRDPPHTLTGDPIDSPPRSWSRRTVAAEFAPFAPDGVLIALRF